MPEILRIFGLRFFFFSREHEPIHVHVERHTARQNLISFPTALCWSIIKA